MAITDKQARAMAYRLVEEIETRALRLMARNPSCTSKAQAMAIVVEAMARLADKRKESGNG